MALQDAMDQSEIRKVFQSAVPKRMVAFGKYVAAEFGTLGWFLHDPANCQSVNWIPIDDPALLAAVWFIYRQNCEDQP